MFIFQVSLTDISFPYRIFFPVFVCFLKRSHTLARGQTEGLSKWRECINAKMIRKSSLQCLDVAASLCRSVPSPAQEVLCRAAACASCGSGLSLRKPGSRLRKESALFLCPGFSIPNSHTSSLCALGACRTPLLLVQKTCRSKS